jgi:uncharacterized protein (DUF1800 family)
MRHPVIGCLSVALVGAFMLGCGGVGKPGSTEQVVSVSVAGPSAVRLGTTAQFSAAVTGTANTAVTWEVNAKAGGSGTYGTISANGLYTPPASIPSAAVVVTAVSVELSTSSSSLTESLENPAPVLTSATATASGTSFLIDAVGTSFIAQSQIQVGGTNQTTTFISSTELQATITAPVGATSLAIAVYTPDPGAITSNSVNVTLPVATPASATAAARLLDQATFGPTVSDLQMVEQEGLGTYITNQFAEPTTLLAAVPTNPLPAICASSATARPCVESEWWQTAITGPDQLRQRVAFALSEMFVVSTQSVPPQSITQFHNALANDAFGNFSTIMKDVSLSPAMGSYLNMLNSAAPATGQIANENYARENMQLFTTGIDLLNQDGSLQLDGSGNPIPAYTQAQVQAFARAYTGWTLANTAGGAVTKFPNNSGDDYDPMLAVEKYHDTTSKTLLNNTVLSAGQTAEQDLSGALANIFAHQNVAPFVCRQLIQHLVTSTPSPAYVSRVAAVFADNGSGVRGDMKAVIRAILLDTEARAGDTNASYDGGHLREPVLFLTAMMRGLGFTNTDANGSYDSLENYGGNLSESVYRANSVFNFFPPDYVIPGTSLNAPEFGIENTATATLRLSLADSIVNNKISSFTTTEFSSTGSLTTLAATPSALVDYLSMAYMHSQMPANMRTTIINAITPMTSNAQRARIAMYLVITSSQYKVIH